MIAFWRWLTALFRRKRLPILRVPTPVPVPAPAPIPVPSPTARRIPLITDFTETLAFADFADGTPGGWSAGATTDFPDDPTGILGGKVARILYSTPGGFASSDRHLEFVPAHRFRYNEPLLFKGKFFLPRAVVSGGPQNFSNGRKLIDWFTGGAPHTRLVLERESGNLRYHVGQYEPDGQWHVDVTYGKTGIVLNDDQWYDIAVMILPNSADGVRDGLLQIWVDNPTPTPNFTLEGLSPITERDGAISCFEELHVGAQLTTQPDDPAMSQYRLWKDVGLYTTRAA